MLLGDEATTDELPSEGNVWRKFLQRWRHPEGIKGSNGHGGMRKFKYKAVISFGSNNPAEIKRRKWRNISRKSMDMTQTLDEIVLRIVLMKRARIHCAYRSPSRKYDFEWFLEMRFLFLRGQRFCCNHRKYRRGSLWNSWVDWARRPGSYLDEPLKEVLRRWEEFVVIKYCIYRRMQSNVDGMDVTVVNLKGGGGL